jgi:flagellar hook-basal body complex protein FliE
MDGIRTIGGELLPTPDAAQAPRGRAGAFAQVLGEAIAQADALQTGADAEAARSALGAGNLHETALALEKADVAMRVLTKVRNKIVDAYQEVMRMSV